MKEGKVFKRILAIALVVVMTITMMPFGVFAEGEETTTPDAGSSEVVTPADPETPAACEHVWVNGVCSECEENCTHAYKRYVAEKAATCIAEGNIAYYICKTCNSNIRGGKVFLGNVTKAIDPNNHASTETELKNKADATCTSKGYTGDTVYKCCGAEVAKGEDIPMAEHTTDTRKVDERLPSCGEAGYYKLETYCTVCDTVTKEEEFTPAATGEHNYTTEKAGTKVEATCTTAGKVTKVCACGAEREETIAIVPTAHKFINTGKCEYCGTDCTHSWTAGVCTVCGDTCEHTGGTAKCNAKAECTTCGEEYGSFDATNHADTTELRNKADATCTAKGYTGDTVYKCCDAEVAKGTEIDMLDHSYTVEVTTSKVASTCATKGSVDMKCATCDAINPEKKELDLDPTNHEGFTKEVEGTKTPATCVATGSVKMECACGDRKTVTLDIDNTAHDLDTLKKLSDTEHGKPCKREGCTYVADKAAHAYTEVIATVLPTCVTKGSKTTKCVCGDEKTEVLNENDNHDWGVYTETKAPTCTEKGTKEAACKREGCAEKDIKEIPALGHDMEEVAAKEATCKEAGNNKYYACDRCDKFFKDEAGAIETTVEAETIAKGEHKFTKYNVVKDATCEANAVEKATCDVCEEATHERAMPGTMLAHTFKDYKSDGNATCKVDGTMTAVCEMCKEAKDTKTEVDSHKTAPHTPDAAGVKCTLCGEMLVCLHTYSTEKLITKTPTCTTDGQKAIVCSKCKANKPGSEEVIPALGHSFTNYISDGNATCTVDGTQTAYCDNGCGMSDTIIEEAVGHDINPYRVEKVATCTEEGLIRYKCFSCDYTYTEIEPKKSHDLWDSKDIQPTCTDDGLVELYCSNCDYTYTETIPSTGHNYPDDWSVLVEPDCETKGINVKICLYCNDLITQKLPKAGHADLDGDSKCDTCEMIIVVEPEEPTEPDTPNEPEEKPCDCDCHAGGIKAFFFKLLNFFAKIFDKSARVCECGKSH